MENKKEYSFGDEMYNRGYKAGYFVRKNIHIKNRIKLNKLNKKLRQISLICKKAIKLDEKFKKNLLDLKNL